MTIIFLKKKSFTSEKFDCFNLTALSCICGAHDMKAIDIHLEPAYIKIMCKECNNILRYHDVIKQASADLLLLFAICTEEKAASKCVASLALLMFKS